MRGLREGTRHWVLEAPCEGFFNLRQLRIVPIDWVMYQVKEFLHTKRYSTCQAYGHTANSKECKFVTPFCGCCGLRHNTRSCRKDELCCINCAESNRNRGTNYKIRHRSIGKESLPCYNKEVTAYRKTRTIFSINNSIFENIQFPYNITTESSNEPLKILQIKLAKAKEVTNQLHLTASTIKPDIILVQEQCSNNNGIPGIPQTWKTFSSSNQKAAILIPSSKL
ncbi:hypothetical protein AVEN_25765-1 [Araneus ventricosus]|uniref:Endonuclease/exonuclease/phosphatase domain-containing protein n=1 Tax=Araneus ventricosus TaxID=182803 RepID=A0A4Y2IM54_ARAVE|nr:hypothetical protein AVEN_25765-1 [Araneus ventricosus]